MTTKPQSTTEEPNNASGKPLFPETLTMVACDQCDEAQPWPLRCGHTYVGIHSREYARISPASAAPAVDDRELGADTNFPLSETLMLSVEWLQHIHDSHECDCHGWEQRSFLIASAQRYQDEIKRNAFAAATAAPVRQSDDERLIALLLDWRKWYSEDLFTPWTIEEAQRVHDEFPGAVDRISAESARGTIDHVIEDIRAGKHRVTPEDDE